VNDIKKLLYKQRNDTPHWVGDGFPVRSIFSYNNLAHDISPFLLMDYAGPTEFSPTSHRRGVGEHPHRGFETVTIVYAGEVEHRDSSGGGGIIKSGDVQWMTAASGLVHEEFHGPEFAKHGGRFEMIQLWVNLPKEFKMTKPRYQGIRNESIPKVVLPNQAGSLRLIAGEVFDQKGPAKTFSPVNLWDIRLTAGSRLELEVPEGHTTSLFVLSGKVRTHDGESIEEAEIGIFDPQGTKFQVQAERDSVLLFLGGEPIDEPVVGYGPFVMNSPAEIKEAFHDYETGKMGVLERIEGAE
jgi:redox-sensitive bicupin YhaK (pirin superfamily)